MMEEGGRDTQPRIPLFSPIRKEKERVEGGRERRKRKKERGGRGRRKEVSFTDIIGDTFPTIRNHGCIGGFKIVASSVGGQ